ncbi:RsfA family transcriptional regulator [Metabacillus sp. GX 13764]|uniref:RsfA family transcriptional regulator n=1 Tax=Metabacillus kandeliae TaxID=2900151 RepID=UPI001E50890E|nr:RsfA family transcriptional regulator [Metabacillus kandeliae]MCD7034729.1 RsfA family transcriptional regulator [Metabacillus kandeliae]
MKQRQDAWSEENDLLLAETVLRHVREGSTQLNAFEEVGDKLNRTSAACGFRWNAVVRHQYEKALQLAKKQRKQKMRAQGSGQPAKKKLLYNPDPAQTPSVHHYLEEEEASETLTASEISSHYEAEIEDSDTESYEIPVFAPVKASHSLTMDQVIAFLQNYDVHSEHAAVLKQENERLKREVKDLIIHNEELQSRISKMEENTHTIQEDYETLMKIMNRARKLTLFEEEERPAAKFKMDRNGNLEKLAE